MKRSFRGAGILLLGALCGGTSALATAAPAEETVVVTAKATVMPGAGALTNVELECPPGFTAVTGWRDGGADIDYFNFEYTIGGQSFYLLSPGSHPPATGGKFVLTSHAETTTTLSMLCRRSLAGAPAEVVVARETSASLSLDAFCSAGRKVRGAAHVFGGINLMPTGETIFYDAPSTLAVPNAGQLPAGTNPGSDMWGVAGTATCRNGASAIVPCTTLVVGAYCSPDEGATTETNKALRGDGPDADAAEASRTITAKAVVAPGQTATSTALCPSGRIATSGGFAPSGGPLQLVASYAATAGPTYAGRAAGIQEPPVGWTVVTRNPSASPVTVTTHAVCVNPGPSYQGMWWNAPAASESGWGINFAHQGTTIFATWFTFGPDGKPLWVVVAATLTAANTYTGTLYTGTGPPYTSVPFDPSLVVPTAVGTATFTFTDANNATFAYTLNGISQTKQITRELFSSPVPVCAWAAQPNLAQATNYQDMWWASPAGSESGWGVNFAHQGDTIFATWFTFGPDGKPLWLVVAANKTAPGVYAGKLFTGTGPPFNAVPFDPTQVNATEAGTATFTFADGNNATFAYTIGATSQSKAITRQIFTAPGNVCL